MLLYGLSSAATEMIRTTRVAKAVNNHSQYHEYVNPHEWIGDIFLSVVAGTAMFDLSPKRASARMLNGRVHWRAGATARPSGSSTWLSAANRLREVEVVVGIDPFACRL
jgi:hypothetical protein